MTTSTATTETPFSTVAVRSNTATGTTSSSRLRKHPSNPNHQNHGTVVVDVDVVTEDDDGQCHHKRDTFNTKQRHNDIRSKSRNMQDDTTTIVASTNTNTVPPLLLESPSIDPSTTTTTATTPPKRTTTTTTRLQRRSSLRHSSHPPNNGTTDHHYNPNPNPNQLPLTSRKIPPQHSSSTDTAIAESILSTTTTTCTTAMKSSNINQESTASFDLNDLHLMSSNSTEPDHSRSEPILLRKSIRNTGVGGIGRNQKSPQQQRIATAFNNNTNTNNSNYLTLLKSPRAITKRKCRKVKDATSNTMSSVAFLQKFNDLQPPPPQSSKMNASNGNLDLNRSIQW